MNLFLMLNYEMFEIPCEKYYLPIVLLDLREYKLVCQEINSMMLFMRNPRTNIDLLTGVFQFFFEKKDVEESFMGQVQSNLSILYNMDKTKKKEQLPFILFTQGFQLIELLIYFPSFKKQSLLRDIVFCSYPRREGECPICMENRTVINLHNDNYHHEVCRPCLLRISQCPICRIPL